MSSARQPSCALQMPRACLQPNVGQDSPWCSTQLSAPSCAAQVPKGDFSSQTPSLDKPHSPTSSAIFHHLVCLEIIVQRELQLAQVLRLLLLLLAFPLRQTHLCIIVILLVLKRQPRCLAQRQGHSPASPSPHHWGALVPQPYWLLNPLGSPREGQGDPQRWGHKAPVEQPWGGTSSAHNHAAAGKPPCCLVLVQPRQRGELPQGAGMWGQLQWGEVWCL